MKRTPMRIAIPVEMREELAEDPFMRRCILQSINCEGVIQWNHGFTYAGKRQNELWAILPMCKFHHDKEAQWRLEIANVMRHRITYFNATNTFKEKYPKSILI